jgi:hypothetical protein
MLCQLKDLYNNQRHMPVVSISKEALGACLKVFPKQDAGTHRIIAKDSSRLRSLASKRYKHLPVDIG